MEPEEEEEDAAVQYWQPEEEDDLIEGEEKVFRLLDDML